MTNVRILNFINGEYVEATSGNTFQDRNPATGQLVAIVEEAGRDDIDRAVSAARAALNGDWGKSTVFERAALLNRVADGIMARRDEFVAAEMADTGKLKGPTMMGEIPRAAEQFRLFAAIASNPPNETMETRTPDGGRALNYTQRVPRGVVAAICPWNLPLMMMSWKVAPALAHGNAVVVKPSEVTPATAALMGEVMNAAGLPPGAFNVVQGLGPDSAGEYLVQHPDVDGITFTGETATGEAIMKNAATGIRAVSLELGGKNPGIIFADSDFDKAIEGTMASCFINCGQMCIGTERLYVERPIFDRFVETLKERASALAPGDPDDPKTTIGPSISEEQRDKVLSFYKKAADDGASVVTGGGVPDMAEEWAGGAWVEPTIWTGLAEDSAVVKNEVFGPNCHIAPFDEEDQAVALANDTIYGLAATVWSTNISRANRVASQLRVGTCWINSWMIRELRAPFGGFGASGTGREGGVHSFDFYTEIRNVCTRI